MTIRFELFSTDIANRAFDFAKARHQGQFRKMEGARADVPYIVHPYRVGKMLDSLTWPVIRSDDFPPIAIQGPEYIVVAGILHDTLEDTDTSFVELVDEFGISVAAYVYEVSHRVPKGTSWPAKNAAYLSQVMYGSFGAKVISLCDKLDNMRSIEKCYAEGIDGFSILKSTPEKQIGKFMNLYNFIYVDLKTHYPELTQAYFRTAMQLWKAAVLSQK